MQEMDPITAASAAGRVNAPPLEGVVVESSDAIPVNPLTAPLEKYLAMKNREISPQLALNHQVMQAKYHGLAKDLKEAKAAMKNGKAIKGLEAKVAEIRNFKQAQIEKKTEEFARLDEEINRLQGLEETAPSKNNRKEIKKLEGERDKLRGLEKLNALEEQIQNTENAQADKKVVSLYVDALEETVAECKREVVNCYLLMLNLGFDGGLDGKRYKETLGAWKISGHIYAASSQLMNFATTIPAWRTLKFSLEELRQHGDFGVQNAWSNFAVQLGVLLLTPPVNSALQLFFVPLEELNRKGFSKRCEELKAPGLAKLEKALTKNAAELKALETTMAEMTAEYPALTERLVELVAKQEEADDPAEIEEQIQATSKQIDETHTQLGELRDEHTQCLGERAEILQQQETILKAPGSEATPDVQAEAHLETTQAEIEVLGAEIVSLAERADQAMAQGKDIPADISQAFVENYTKALALMNEIGTLCGQKGTRDGVIEFNELGQGWQGLNRAAKVWMNMIGIAASVFTKNPHIFAHVQGWGTLGTMITHQFAGSADLTAKQQGEKGGVLEGTALATRLIKEQKWSSSPETWTVDDLIPNLGKVVRAQWAEPIDAGLGQVKEWLEYKIRRTEDKIAELNADPDLRDLGAWRERNTVLGKGELNAADHARLHQLDINDHLEVLPHDVPASNATVPAGKRGKLAEKIAELKRLRKDLQLIKDNKWNEVGADGARLLSEEVTSIVLQAIDAVEGKGWGSFYNRLRTARRTMESRWMQGPELFSQVGQRGGASMQGVVLNNTAILLLNYGIKLIEAYINRDVPEGETHSHLPSWGKLIPLTLLAMAVTYIALNYGNLVNNKITRRGVLRKIPALDHTGFRFPTFDSEDVRRPTFDSKEFHLSYNSFRSGVDWNSGIDWKDLGALLNEIGNAMFAVPRGQLEKRRANKAANEAKSASASFRRRIMPPQEAEEVEE